MSINSYIPLARKYRPSTFSELSGQDATATALANAIRLGREPHAVIFSGVRGIGKTTSARLYAKALNCEQPVNAEPCNKCESCAAITIGNHEDVMEIDGASNTSVDDVRALRETVAYVPQRSRFKVYIIDEVHMLSQSAFNALLKTLEEPPAHVVFIFATTELHKIPQTIMSRCQVFHLQRLGSKSIRDRILHILKAENIGFDDKAVVAIAREGHGSMRDALTLLDHVIAVGNGRVSVEALEKIISHVSSTQYLQLLNALVTRNAQQIITGLDELENSGIMMQDCAEKLAMMARHAFIIRDVGSESLDFKALGFDDEETSTLNNIALAAGPADLNRIFRTLARACVQLDGSSLDRYVLENHCLEWCMDPGILSLSVPLSHTLINTNQAPAGHSPSSTPPSRTQPDQTARMTVANIRESIQSKPVAPQAKAPEPTVNSEVSQSKGSTSVDSAPKTDGKSLPMAWRDCVEIWKKHNPLQAKRLEDVHPVVYSATRIELVVPSESFLSAALLKPDEQKKLRDAFTDLFGFSGIITFQAKKKDEASSIETTEKALPETVATIQQRENAAKREKVIAEAQNHPVTKDAQELFNATIESVEMNR